MKTQELELNGGITRDGRNLNLVEKYWGDDPIIQKRLEIERENPYDTDYPVRSMEYVEQECMSLVDQIIELSCHDIKQ